MRGERRRELLACCEQRTRTPAPSKPDQLVSMFLYLNFVHFNNLIGLKVLFYFELLSTNEVDTYLL